MESITELAESDPAALTLIPETLAEEDEEETPLDQAIAEAYTDDAFTNEILELLRDGAT